MQFRQLTLAFLCFLPFCGAASALDEDQAPFFTRSDAQTAIQRALHTIHKIKCGKELCTKATSDEFADPPIGMEDARLALFTGAQSARLHWCGLDWKKRAYPMMLQDFRQRGVHSRRVLALLNLIHNAQFSKDVSSLQALKTCSEATRTALDKRNPEVEMPPWQGRLNRALLDEEVTHMLRRILDQIHNSNCGITPCEPATDAEKENPPISVELARQAMKVGLMSGVAEFCGLDWKEKVFFPLMAHFRYNMKMEPRQLAMMGMLHGTMQDFMLRNYKKHEKTCSEKLKAGVTKQLPKKSDAAE